MPRRHDLEHDSHRDGDGCHHLEHPRIAKSGHKRARGDGAQCVPDVVDRAEDTVSGRLADATGPKIAVALP